MTQSNLASARMRGVKQVSAGTYQGAHSPPAGDSKRSSRVSYSLLARGSELSGVGHRCGDGRGNEENSV